jgi:hypothetical protein
MKMRLGMPDEEHLKIGFGFADLSKKYRVIYKFNDNYIYLFAFGGH